MLPHPHRRPIVAALVAAALLAAPPLQAQVSRNLTLLANMNLHSGATGIWSYIHHDGREYVALGTRTGTSIVRLTVPTAPVEVAFIPGVTAGTRDIRQYRTHLYIVANLTAGGATAGIQIVDMADPDLPVLVSTYTSTVQTAEYANVDSTRALLFVSEANGLTEVGGTHILSLADPVNIVEVGAYTPPYRIHDFHPHGNVGYACAIDDQVVDIVDISNPATPTLVSSFSTPVPYPHSSWTTDDGAYLFLTQEWISPDNFGRPSVFDVRDPTNAVLTWTFNDLPDAVSHIPVIRGNMAVVSYYSAGVRLFDISVPSRPVEFGFYDTWPGDDFLVLGCYQAAALFPSGLVCAADEASGLYVLQPGADYGIVRGIVRDGGNGMKPLAGVTVRALPNGPATTTAADGSYAFAPSTGASVSIQAEKYGFAPSTSAISVTVGSDQTLDFAMSGLPTGSVKGTVRRASDGTALPGAEVSIVSTPFIGTTNARGVYSFMKVAAGAVDVRAEYTGLVPIVVSGTLSRSFTANFSLPPAPFYDNADQDLGWTLGAPGDDATQGVWVRAVPIGTFNGSVASNPSEDHTPGAGGFCFVTGNNSTVASLSRVAGGKTTLISPVLDLSGVPDPRIVFWRWYYHNALFGGLTEQPFVTEISNDGGASWTTVSRLQRERGLWERVEIRVTDFFPSPGTVRVRFTAENRTVSLVEAAIDDFEYYAGGGGSALAASDEASPERPARLSSPLRITGPTVGGSDLTFGIHVGGRGLVTARVVDVQGRVVATLYRGVLESGRQRLRWDGRTERGPYAGAGIYFLLAEAGGSRATRKFALLR